MSTPMTKGSALLLSLVVILAVLLLIPPVYADTDGTEPKITTQPDRLELQLGFDWAGAEFELKLDSGVFPIPVVVNDSGVLSMDLGGSKTYTLRLLTSPAPAEASPESTTESQTEVSGQPAPAETSDSVTQSNGVPPLHLALFIVGVSAAAGTLIFMHVMKKRREYGGDEYDYDDDDE